MQDEGKAHTDIIPEGGIGNKLIDIPSAGIPSNLFQEGDAIDRYCFRRIDNRGSCHWTAAGTGVLDHGYFHIFFVQVRACLERQIDAGGVVSAPVNDLSFLWIVELEAVFGVGEGQPITCR